MTPRSSSTESTVAARIIAAMLLVHRSRITHRFVNASPTSFVRADTDQRPEDVPPSRFHL
jgi:hypothetical protein